MSDEAGFVAIVEADRAVEGAVCLQLHPAFYIAATFIGALWNYDYDIDTGSLSSKRIFDTTKDDEGVAD